jgi:chloramphenicol-sensitive protein RarD
MSRLRFGFASGVAAYLIWGLFPLYWPLLEPAASIEILAHRVVWSLLFVGAVLGFTTGFGYLHALTPRQVGLLALAAVLVTTNWGVFIYAVNSEQVVESSLGYFINPLVTVGLAVAILHERLRPDQKIAVAIATAAVVVLAIDYGRPPWIALTLAGSFALYGLIKKRADVDGTQSLAVETALLTLPAAGYLVWLDGTFTTEGTGHIALLIGAGVTTAVPLMLFGTAAVRIPLASLGLLQYITPTMQFTIGVLVYGEDMPLSRFAGFALVWIALAVFAVDAARALGTQSAKDGAMGEHEHLPAGPALQPR